MPKNPSRARTKSHAYRKKDKKRFRPGQRVTPPAPKPAGRPATISTSSARPVSPSKQQPVPVALTYVPGEAKKIGTMFGAMVFFLFIFSLLLPRGAYIPAGVLGFFLLLFVFLSWRKSGIKGYLSTLSPLFSSFSSFGKKGKDRLLGGVQHLLKTKSPSAIEKEEGDSKGEGSE